jgi:hypothetical protein
MGMVLVPKGDENAATIFRKAPVDKVDGSIYKNRLWFTKDRDGFIHV